MRLHVGSGTIYLRGWVNIDVPGERTHLAADRPDLVEQYITDENDYYGRHGTTTIDSLRLGARASVEYVCDRYGSFQRLYLGEGVADEVLARQTFEHLSMTEAARALQEVYTVLRPGGLLRLDVPDTEATLHQWGRTHDPFYLRHLLGPRTSAYGYHMMSYTRDGLRSLVEEHGFTYDEEEENIHLYPAFCLRFRRGAEPNMENVVRFPTPMQPTRTDRELMEHYLAEAADDAMDLRLSRAGYLELAARAYEVARQSRSRR